MPPETAEPGTINAVVGPSEATGIAPAPDQGGPAGFGLDPETAALLQDILGGSSDAAKKADPTITAGERAYFQIWGVKPPKGYIKSLAEQGLNVNEIIQHELSKPAATRTFYYRDQYARFAAQLSQLMGARP